MQRRMLTKEEEATTGEEMEVRREDQDKINKFSTLHQKELRVKEELAAKEKEKEDVESVLEELELEDEDSKVPYKIGDCFISLPHPEVIELLNASIAKVDEDVGTLRETLDGIEEQMNALKKVLYGRFGRSINLET